MRAAKSGDLVVMQLLLEKGADPLIVQKNQTTALIVAAGIGWKDGGDNLNTLDRGTQADAIEALKLCLETRPRHSCGQRRRDDCRSCRRHERRVGRDHPFPRARTAPRWTQKNNAGTDRRWISALARKGPGRRFRGRAKDSQSAYRELESGLGTKTARSQLT